MKSGREPIPGQVSSVGVPRARKILPSWSRSESPARKGTWRRVSLPGPIPNVVVQSIELQGNRGGTAKSCQNSRGIGIA